MRVVFDERRFVAALVREMGAALDAAGKRALKLMRENLKVIPKSGSGTTGRPEWHQEVANAIRSVRDRSADGVIAQLVGLVNSQRDQYFFVKAKLLEDGSEAFGRIWHHQGLPGMNADLTGLNTNPETLAKASYPLPESFTQGGQHWFADAVKLIQEVFDEEVEAAWNRINPWDYINTVGR